VVNKFKFKFCMSVCLYVCRLVICLVHVSVCGGMSVEVVPVCLMRAADIVRLLSFCVHVGHRIGFEPPPPPCFRQLPYSQYSWHSWLCVLQTPTLCVLPPPLIYPRTGLEMIEVHCYTQSGDFIIVHTCDFCGPCLLTSDLCQLMVANVTGRKECCT